MGQVFNTPIAREFKNDGSIGAGYKLFFYTTGTSTKKTVYKEEALTTPLTNPVVADANGRFPQIFLEGTGRDYKAILGTDTETDPPTSPIWTVDPVDTFNFDANSFDPRPAQHWGTTAGTAAAYTISATDGLSGYSDDLLFTVQAHITNTASPTLNVSSISAINLKKYDNAGAKVALEAGDMQAGQTYLIRVDSTDAVCLNPGIPYLDLKNSSLSAGIVIGFASDTVPSGWLECDGATISRVTYANLFTAIGTVYGIGNGTTTFEIPDYRGEFIRGWDNGAGVDPDAGTRTDSGDGSTTGDNVGTKQTDVFEAHIHTVPGVISGGAGAGATPVQQNAGTTTNTSSTGGNETRPTNVYAMICIKY